MMALIGKLHFQKQFLGPSLRCCSVDHDKISCMSMKVQAYMQLVVLCVFPE